MINPMVNIIRTVNEEHQLHYLHLLQGDTMSDKYKVPKTFWLVDLTRRRVIHSTRPENKSRVSEILNLISDNGINKANKKNINKNMELLLSLVLF
jgi:hypothetical protein